MPNRRTFLHQVASGAACVAASRIAAPRSVLGANDRVRFGLIGAGGRGKEIFKAALRLPNVESLPWPISTPAGFDEAQELAPAVKTYATTASSWMTKTSTRS